jgi:hypothetical protein
MVIRSVQRSANLGHHVLFQNSSGINYLNLGVFDHLLREMADLCLSFLYGFRAYRFALHMLSSIISP